MTKETLLLITIRRIIQLIFVALLKELVAARNELFMIINTVIE